MESPLDQIADTHMEIDARSAYTYVAVTMSAAATMNLVDAGIQYLAACKDDAGRWLENGEYCGGEITAFASYSTCGLLGCVRVRVFRMTGCPATSI